MVPYQICLRVNFINIVSLNFCCWCIRCSCLESIICSHCYLIPRPTAAIKCHLILPCVCVAFPSAFVFVKRPLQWIPIFVNGTAMDNSWSSYPIYFGRCRCRSIRIIFAFTSFNLWWVHTQFRTSNTKGVQLWQQMFMLATLHGFQPLPPLGSFAFLDVLVFFSANHVHNLNIPLPDSSFRGNSAFLFSAQHIETVLRRSTTSARIALTRITF